MDYLALAEQEFGPVIRFEGSTEGVFTCPSCSHSLNCNILSGLYRCFYCEVRGKLQSESVDDPRIPDNYDIKLQVKILDSLFNSWTLRDSGIKFLRSKALKKSDEFFKQSGSLYSTTRFLFSNWTKTELAFSGLIFPQYDDLRSIIKPNRLMFPYLARSYGPAQNTLPGYKKGQCFRSGYKARFVQETVLIEDAPKYIFPPGKGVGRFLYQPKRFNSKTLIVVEGELKCLALQERGFDCVSIPGISTTRNLQNELKAIFKLYDRVFIMLDSDVGRYSKKPLLKAVDTLLKLSKNTFIAWVPQPNKSEKQDFNDYFLKYHEDDFLELLEFYYFNQQIYINKLFEALKDLW